MTAQHYDIVRKENEKLLLWLEDAADLNEATSRIQELVSFWPGEFQVFDRVTHKVVARIASRHEDDKMFSVTSDPKNAYQRARGSDDIQSLDG